MQRVVSFVRSKLARRTFFLFIVGALLPVCILTLVSLHEISAKLEQSSNERLRQVAKNAGMAIFDGLHQLRSELESMSTPSGGASRQAARIRRDKRFRAVTLIQTDTTGGNLIPGTPSLLSNDHYAHLDEENALIFADSNLGPGDSLYMVTQANQSLPPHMLLLGEINPAYLWNMVERTQIAGIDICILGPSGKTLYTTGHLSPSLVSRVMSAQKGHSSGQLKWHGTDGEYLVNYRSVFLKPDFRADSWTVLAVQSKQDLQGSVRSFVYMFLLVVLLTLFVVVFMSSILIRRSLVPLSVLKESASQLSKGNFDARVDLSSGDEFEELATSFNNMSKQLGAHFNLLSEGGKLIQSILEANDRETIVDRVMTCFRNFVPCEWLGISLVTENDDLTKLTTYSSYNNGAVTEIMQFCTPLSEEELAHLQATTGSLRIKSLEGFSTLLTPLAAEEAGDFFLLPISIKNRLLGILILGYRSAPEPFREELLRSRQIADEMAISLDNVRLIDELQWLNRGTIEALANAVDAKSPWTAGHSERVTKLAVAIGKEMGFSPSELKTLQLAGMFHDMGKLGIPEEILDKPDRLTEEEFALIKKHPEKGAKILEPIRAYHAAIPIVAQHHEQYDGQGYPLGLAGEEIVLGARIMAVADVFDALYFDRPYRLGRNIGKVISYLQEMAGSQFDPKVVKAFLKIEPSMYLTSPLDIDMSRPTSRTYVDVS